MLTRAFDPFLYGVVQSATLMCTPDPPYLPCQSHACACWPGCQLQPLASWPKPLPCTSATLRRLALAPAPPLVPIPSCPPVRFQAYASEYDDDVKDLQRRDLTPQQRLAAQVRRTQRHGGLSRGQAGRRAGGRWPGHAGHRAGRQQVQRSGAQAGSQANLHHQQGAGKEAYCCVDKPASHPAALLSGLHPPLSGHLPPPLILVCLGAAATGREAHPARDHGWRAAAAGTHPRYPHKGTPRWHWPTTVCQAWRRPLQIQFSQHCCDAEPLANALAMVTAIAKVPQYGSLGSQRFASAG